MLKFRHLYLAAIGILITLVIVAFFRTSVQTRLPSASEAASREVTDSAVGGAPRAGIPAAPTVSPKMSGAADAEKLGRGSVSSGPAIAALGDRALAFEPRVVGGRNEVGSPSVVGSLPKRTGGKEHQTEARKQAPEARPGDLFTAAISLADFPSSEWSIEVSEGTLNLGPASGRLADLPEGHLLLSLQLADDLPAGELEIARVRAAGSSYVMPVRVHVTGRDLLRIETLSDSVEFFPGGEFEAQWLVINDGNRRDEVSLSAVLPTRWRAEAMPRPISIDAGDSVRFRTTVRSTGAEVPGQAFEVGLRARGKEVSALGHMVAFVSADRTPFWSMPVTLSMGSVQDGTGAFVSPAWAARVRLPFAGGYGLNMVYRQFRPLMFGSPSMRDLYGAGSFEGELRVPAGMVRAGSYGGRMHEALPMQMMGQGGGGRISFGEWALNANVAQPLDRSGWQASGGLSRSTGLGQVRVEGFDVLVSDREDLPQGRASAGLVGWRPIDTRRHMLELEGGSARYVDFAGTSSEPFGEVRYRYTASRVRAEGLWREAAAAPWFLPYRASSEKRISTNVVMVPKRWTLSTYLSERATPMRGDVMPDPVRSLQAATGVAFGPVGIEAGYRFMPSAGDLRMLDAVSLGAVVPLGPFRAEARWERGRLDRWRTIEEAIDGDGSIGGGLASHQVLDRDHFGTKRLMLAWRSGPRSVYLDAAETEHTLMGGRLRAHLRAQDRWGPLSLRLGLRALTHIDSREWADLVADVGTEFEVPGRPGTALVGSYEYHQSLAPRIFLGMKVGLNVPVPKPRGLVRQGRVYEEGSGASAGVAGIRLRQGSESVVSDSRGRFLIPDTWKGRRVDLDQSSIPPHLLYLGSSTVVIGDAGDALQFGLMRKGAAKVRVLAPRSLFAASDVAPADGARVTLFNRDAGTAIDVRAGPDGVAMFDAVFPGTFEVYVEHPERPEEFVRDAFDPIVVVAGQTAEIELVLELVGVDGL